MGRVIGLTLAAMLFLIMEIGGLGWVFIGAGFLLGSYLFMGGLFIVGGGFCLWVGWKMCVPVFYGKPLGRF